MVWIAEVDIMYKLLCETRSWVAQRLVHPAYILGVWRGPGFKSYNSHYSRVNLSEVASAGFTREKIGHRTFFFFQNGTGQGLLDTL